MTTLFVSHGAPTLAIEPGKTGALLEELAASLPHPKAILVVSAHWDTPEVKVGAAVKPETIHDFTGFPQSLYEISYPANGAPALAAKTASLLKAAGIATQQDATRGLDHGAWVPLMLMYPDADISVAQLSIQTNGTPLGHYKIGQAISQLQDENVLILCSGAITHNLRDFFTVQRDSKTLEYVHEFSNWVGDKIAYNETEALFNYRNSSKNGIRAHPTEDHIMPLFVALGAAHGQATRYQPEDTFGILAMDAYCWQ
ncbi:MAG: class III extradiol ring-cleavage dioxygenase [Methylotenera sp.]|nr:class III extradiol ring-cleavage dioxygenase [Methylotenera sp.]